MFRAIPIRSFEQLEARSLLSGHPLSRLTAVLPHRIDDIAALVSSRFSGTSTSAATSLSATLTDANDSGVTGSAKFTSYTHDGTTTSSFTASIKGAATDTTYTVNIDGTPVGNFTTDANGNGKLSLTGSLAVAVAAGDTVDISAADGTALASGALVTSTNIGCHGGDVNVDVTRLAASLSDSTGMSTATGNVNFTSYTDDDGNVETKLAVSVKGADANTTFNVVIDGTQVGQLTTDANGNGSVVLKGGLAVTPAANSAVSIVNSTTGATTIGGTLDTSSAFSGRFSFGRRGR